jgi:hypothetical protein
MKKDWLEFALKLAEGARAGVAKDRERLESLRAKQTSSSELQVVSSSK